MADTGKSSKPPGRLTGLWLGLALVVAITALEAAGAFDGLERLSYDLRFLIRGQKAPHSDVLLVTIDESTRKTLDKAIGSITRAEHARVLEALNEAGAMAVVFDMDFATSKPGDEKLAREIACAGNVILSSFIAMGGWVRPRDMFLDTEVPCVTEEAVVDASKIVTVDENGVADIRWKPRPGRVINGFRVFYSLNPIKDTGAVREGSGGHVDVAADEDSLELTVQGVPAGTKLYVAVKGLRFGSLLGEGAVNIIEDPDARVRRMPAIVGRSAEDPNKRAALALETAIRVRYPAHPELIQSTDWKLVMGGDEDALKIPLVNGNILINYRGGRDTYPRISFGDVLKGDFDPEKVEGKIALVGNTHQLAHDEYPTPFGGQKISSQDTAAEGVKTGYTPGLEIHANTLDTILTKDFIVPLSLFLDNKIKDLLEMAEMPGQRKWRLEIIEGGIVFLAGLVSMILFMLWRPPLAAGATILAALLVTVAIGSYAGFVRGGLWIPVAAPASAVVALYAGGLFNRARLHERERTWIKDTFGKYLAPTVVDEIIKDPSLVELGGVEKELTAFFSDIEKFSTISEKLGDAGQLVGLLNEYLSAMARVIEKYGGTIDKYEGDAIMAFWGAPLSFEDHAVRACNAALEMQAALSTLREKWRREGNRPDLVKNMRVRMGLNTGPMVVGNMGSEGRLNYTIMGDEVNLASRLEGANKQYGTYIMIARETYKQVKNHFEVRFLDMVAVAGKERPVRVYELMGRKGSLSRKRVRMLKAYNDGVVSYRKMNWGDAISSFEAALNFIPEDGPSRTYLERCRLYLEKPPPSDWDGVFRLSDK